MSHFTDVAERRRTLPQILAVRAQEQGDKPFIRFAQDPDASMSYGRLFTEAENAGSRLRAEHRLDAGDVVAILLPNGRDFIRSWCASLFAGLVDVTINTDFKKATLFYGLSTVSAKAIFTDESGLERLLDPEVRAYFAQRMVSVVLSGPVSDEMMNRASKAAPDLAFVTLQELIEPTAPRRYWSQVDASSLASIRYTSGTTGPAKGIMYSHLFMLNRTAIHNEVFTLGAEDVLYSPFPLYHALSGVMATVGTLIEGATMVSARRFSASNFWRDIREHHATLAHILFPLIPMLLKQPPEASDREHKVRYLYTAWPHDEFEKRFGTQLIQVYAQSEVGVMAYRRGGTEDRGRNVGRPLPDVEVAIVDETDRFLPPGETGEIVVRPRVQHRIMLGYYNNFAATARAFRNLWQHTGDQGLLDENGELSFLGRLGDTIRRRGMNISSEQIDEEIARHPNVLECAVIGVPADVGEEDIHACIVWRDAPADEAKGVAELFEYMRARLPRPYVPRFLEVCTALPRTNTGKFRKSELKGRTAFGRSWDEETQRWVGAGR
jgi:crotonobetaine/carnitine-CoA ligase